MRNDYRIPLPAENTLKVEAELDIFSALRLLKLGALRAARGTPLTALQELFVSRSPEIGRAFEFARREKAVEWLDNVLHNQPILTHEEKAAIYTAAIAILQPPIFDALPGAKLSDQA